MQSNEMLVIAFYKGDFTLGIRLRLGLMMFLQYAIWGAWAPVLGTYLGPNPQGGIDATHLGFSGAQMGWIFALLPLATIISPTLFGQIADRWAPTQRVMAILHMLAGISMIAMSTQTGFAGIIWLMAAFSFFYAPTLALSNSICFNHMKDPEREFGGLRVWGTIGWIVAGWVLSSARGGFGGIPTSGAWKSLSTAMTGVDFILTPFANGAHAVMSLAGAKADLLVLSGLAAIVLGVFSFALPNTPPKKEGANPFAFLEALKLFKNRNFTVFMVISFIVGTELEFYYMLTAPFLAHLGISDGLIPWVMTVAQAAEIIVMAILLPRLLPKIGARKMLAIGAIAWPLRYAIFALLPIKSLVIASLTLHGFCYVFFFVVGFIYVDTVAPKDIRASAQSLMAIVILGLGRCLGSLFTGTIRDLFTYNQTVNWQGLFLVPCFLTVACAIAFLLAFKEQKVKAGVEG
ncbi:MAG: MFS transporter [Armatimonadota bacterium]|nr:MFS transporter [Armatimonadota bacterium]